MPSHDNPYYDDEANTPKGELIVASQFTDIMNRVNTLELGAVTFAKQILLDYSPRSISAHNDKVYICKSAGGIDKRDNNGEVLSCAVTEKIEHIWWQTIDGVSVGLFLTGDVTVPVYPDYAVVPVSGYWCGLMYEDGTIFQRFAPYTSIGGQPTNPMTELGDAMQRCFGGGWIDDSDDGPNILMVGLGGSTDYWGAFAFLFDADLVLVRKIPLVLYVKPPPSGLAYQSWHDNVVGAWKTNVRDADGAIIKGQSKFNFAVEYLSFSGGNADVKSLSFEEDITSTIADVAGIDGVQIELTVEAGHGAKFPPVPFFVDVDDEKMRVTAVVNDTFTIERGASSTTPTVHAFGALVIEHLTEFINFGVLNHYPPFWQWAVPGSPDYFYRPIYESHVGFEPITDGARLSRGYVVQLDDVFGGGPPAYPAIEFFDSAAAARQGFLMYPGVSDNFVTPINPAEDQIAISGTIVTADDRVYVTHSAGSPKQTYLCVFHRTITEWFGYTTTTKTGIGTFPPSRLLKPYIEGTGATPPKRLRVPRQHLTDIRAALIAVLEAENYSPITWPGYNSPPTDFTFLNYKLRWNSGVDRPYTEEQWDRYWDELNDPDIPPEDKYQLPAYTFPGFPRRRNWYPFFAAAETALSLGAWGPSVRGRGKYMSHWPVAFGKLLSWARADDALNGQRMDDIDIGEVFELADALKGMYKWHGV